MGDPQGTQVRRGGRSRLQCREGGPIVGHADKRDSSPTGALDATVLAP